MSAGIARIITDLALDREFDYRIPEEWRGKICIGSVVRIPFGRRRARGFVTALPERSAYPDLKSIEGLVDVPPLFDAAMLRLARWMADYYAAPFEQAIAALLPAAVHAQPAPDEPPLEAQPGEAAQATLPTVMVVDDSLTVRKITSRLLMREGYQVVLAKDGVDALEQLIEVMPDVILSDIEMPRMDGFDLVRNIRADERLRGLPVIMITSRTADKHRNYALEIGANHYLGKPYDEVELLDLVAGYTRARRQH